MSTNMFEIAARNKFRFPFKGMISTEDLWDLSVENLDNVFKTLNSEMKKTKEESLLSTKSKADEMLELKIEIVKHIVTVKQEEKEAREKKFLDRERNQKIMSIIAAKQDEQLHNMSVEELQKLLVE
ncbi:hypothetical protein HMPREF0490_00776 [Lachnospiraceae bacterium 6_1_37FAA]|nr:hypothetical protein HMPREF0490_00776 [Lachnospiraceae bacterium 6_1_37FAA]